MDRKQSVFDSRQTLTRAGVRPILGFDNVAFIEQSPSRERERKLVRNTGIICTIGPASKQVDTLEKMIASGMNIARLNMAHSSHEQLATFIKNVREAAYLYSMRTGSNVSVAVALETTGAQIRTGRLENNMDEVSLIKGDNVTITTDPEFKEKCNEKIIYINGGEVIKSIMKASIIILDDEIHLKVESVGKMEAICTILNSRNLGNWKKVCFPGGSKENFLGMSKEDKMSIEFALEQNVDMIILADVKSGECIIEARKILGEKGKHIYVISKFRNMSAIENATGIIHESDGVMIAREELGVVIPVEKVFVAQKNIISYCIRNGKPIICASVMLRSMIRSPRATQAESTDIANVILDGVDCVVLSGETAIGNYPLESLRTMVKICNEAEDLTRHRYLSSFDVMYKVPMTTDPINILALAAIDSAVKCMATAIMVITATGRTAHMIAKHRPTCPLIMVTREPCIANQSQLYRAIYPILCDIQCNKDPRKDIDAQVQFGILQCKRKRLLEPGNQIVIIIGRHLDETLMHTARIEDVV